MPVDFGEPLPEEERDAMIEKIAMDIHRRGLETPAILFLEMHKPLSFFASQTLIVTTPLIAPIVGFDRVRNAANLLESRDNVELLIRRIEELAASRDRNDDGNRNEHGKTHQAAEPIGASTVTRREETK